MKHDASFIVLITSYLVVMLMKQLHFQLAVALAKM